MKPPADAVRLAADCECMADAVVRIWSLVDPTAGLPPREARRRSEAEAE